MIRKKGKKYYKTKDERNEKAQLFIKEGFGIVKIVNKYNYKKKYGLIFFDKKEEKKKLKGVVIM